MWRIALMVVMVIGTGARAAGFKDVTKELGVEEFVEKHRERVGDWWLSGMTLADLDGDGDLDLHIGSHSGLEKPGALGLNDGKGRFVGVDPKLEVKRGPRARENLSYPGGEIRLVHDIDEDGLPDMLCSWHDGGGVLYLNRSRGGATEFARDDRIDPFSRGTAMADLNGDGLVDYLADGRSDIAVRYGQPGGTFAAKAVAIPGLKESAAVPVDFDDDGKVDLLVSQRGYNAGGRRVLRNAGGGEFVDVTAEVGLDGAAGSIHGHGDVNRDGDVDLICVESDRVVIYLNDGKGKFAAVADGVKNLPRNRPKSTNWGGAIVTDFDNDGVPDVIVNGRYFLYVLRGHGDGTFTCMNEEWGVPTAATSAVDEGLCFGDVDSDGRLDLVVCAGTDKRKSVALLRNELPERGWLRVRVAGKAGNRAAAGAKLRITTPGTGKLLGSDRISIWGRQSFHSYYATARTERHFGLGDEKAVDVEVTFASGQKARIAGVAANSVVEIVEP